MAQQAADTSTIAPYERKRFRVSEETRAGFLAISPQTTGLLTWWWDQARRDALSDVTPTMFTDQRCIDLVPCFFQPVVLRDPGYNVAYSNLHARELALKNGAYTVNGVPLRFFHFSGFDAAKPFLLSKHQLDRPRVLLSERPVLARLCAEYAEDLKRSGWLERPPRGGGWAALPGGVVLTPRIRRLYRQALIESERDATAEPPNPFSPDGHEGFIQWLNEPVEPVVRPIVSRFLSSIYRDRPDLRAAFPDLAGRDASAFLRWVLQDGVVQEKIPDGLLPKPDALARAAEPQFAPADQLTPGVNIVGYFRTVTGVGEHARLLAQSIDRAAIPHATVTIGGTPSRETETHTDRGSRRAPHDVNLLCVNADQTPRIASEFGRSFFDGRYTVGYWAWELERLPESMYPAFDVVDEVWGASRFVTDAVAGANRKPAFAVPYPFPAPAYRKDVTRAAFGLPDRYMVLFMFDFLSVFERKNPIGLIDAFERAFSHREEPFLVIKTLNGDKRLNDLERLRARVADLPNVVLLDACYPAEQKNGLLALCDCYVSLHRSEGTGITLAEAMALGKPVIGTAYSGNLEFMNERNSYLVDYVKTEVPEGCEPYPRGYVWAEPDVDHAAEQLRRVFTRRPEAIQRAAQGQEDILTRHSVEACAVTIAARLDEIRLTRQRRGALAGSAPAGATSGEPAGDLLRQARQLLTPEASLPVTAKLRALRIPAQRLLFRALRPYWFGQREASRLVIDAVQAVDRSLVAQSASIQQALLAETTAIHARLDNVDARVNEQAQNDQARQQDATRARQERTTLQEAVSTFQKSATAHLAALADTVARLEREVQDTTNRLYPVPYMSDPDLLSYVDENGRKVLGFREPATGRGRYLGFEDIFRGSEEFIRNRFRRYLPLLAGAEPVVDIGCGRGELLELIRDAGQTGIGVDRDEDMVTQCRQRGLHVTLSDGIEFLRAQADSSLGAITAFQVIEHLSYECTMAFFEASIAKLKPGGLLIVETVNPHSLEALKSFWVDLTHRHPIFPEVALALCWLRRFQSAYVLFPHGSGDLESDRRSQGEYAVIARKRPAPIR